MSLSTASNADTLGLGREEAIRPAMKVGDDLREPRHGGQRQAPLLRHAVIELRLIEPAHDECPFVRLALRPEDEIYRYHRALSE